MQIGCRLSQQEPGLLQMLNVTPADAGEYHCVAGNARGERYSAEATLSVLSKGRTTDRARLSVRTIQR